MVSITEKTARRAERSIVFFFTEKNEALLAFFMLLGMDVVLLCVHQGEEPLG